jgi:ribosome recycling factor
MKRVGRSLFAFVHLRIIAPFFRVNIAVRPCNRFGYLASWANRVKIPVMPLDDILIDAEMHMEKANDHLLHELRGIRTGRATPALVEHIKVDYYGSPTDLRSIASISVPEATQLLIKPFSPGDLRAIEKAINDSKVGLTPHSDGKTLRLMLPPLSQERRQQLAGQCKQMAETAKIAIRNARRDANKILETEEKGGLVTEDEATNGKEQIQELTKSYEAKVDEHVEKKRAEVMQI